MNIKWIFFDVGSTLVDETKAYDHRIWDMIENTDITCSSFDAKCRLPSERASRAIFPGQAGPY